jgi:hypothetical protein
VGVSRDKLSGRQAAKTSQCGQPLWPASNKQTKTTKSKREDQPPKQGCTQMLQNIITYTCKVSLHLFFFCPIKQSDGTELGTARTTTWSKDLVACLVESHRMSSLLNSFTSAQQQRSWQRWRATNRKKKKQPQLNRVLRGQNEGHCCALFPRLHWLHCWSKCSLWCRH